MSAKAAARCAPPRPRKGEHREGAEGIQNAHRHRQASGGGGSTAGNAGGGS